MTTTTREDDPQFKFKVWVNPSIFRSDNFVLGHYKTKFRAWCAAFWHVHFVNPYAMAVVLEREPKEENSGETRRVDPVPEDTRSGPGVG